VWVYVGAKHTAQAASEQTQLFRCGSCGYRAVARIVGRGQGTAHSPYFINQAEGRERARREASFAAKKNTRGALALAACPTCGWRDPDTVGRYRRHAIKTVVWLSLAAFGVAWVPLRAQTWAPALAAGAALLFALVVYRVLRREWTITAKGVVFESIPP
jgi:predicted RNA-binding Zn-ribbon protein involved in translation (DUF1610 family)